ncbi:hypothetical protein POV26_10550 [Aequorivita todarodis]|uniref:hypothetical protein n=1 Tax=Aequorivita todarodis TaxID=2036821 RepID=UPI002350AB98|nr:hypothetical protein [Aequorivita todarodis]MDC8001481.1 hypothetical protein [Aequorivita todarodis]
MKKILLLIIFISSNTYSQCDWNSFFPFQAGNSKFDIARIKSTNPTVTDTEDNYGMRDAIDKINNGKKKYEYLKDSVYINVINLRFIKNDCFRGTDNSIQITLSDDKLHKGTVELHYDDYYTMKKQYDEILELVPQEYSYTKPFEITNRKTKEKIGEGIWYLTKALPDEGDKINRIGISYSFDFKMVWDKEKREYYRTNEIEAYTIEIDFADLRQSKLTGQGY